MNGNWSNILHPWSLINLKLKYCFSNLDGSNVFFSQIEQTPGPDFRKVGKSLQYNIIIHVYHIQFLICIDLNYISVIFWQKKVGHFSELYESIYPKISSSGRVLSELWIHWVNENNVWSWPCHYASSTAGLTWSMAKFHVHGALKTKSCTHGHRYC